MTLNLTKTQSDSLYELLLMETENKTLCEIRLKLRDWKMKGKKENILDMV